MKNKTFTLIEVMIAIIVFGIGILTIVFMIIQNIGAVDKIKNKTTATFLARESMELIYNIRDTNLDKGILRKCFELDANYSCANSFVPGSAYKVSLNPYGYYNIAPSTQTYGNNILYSHNGLIKDVYGNNMFSGFWYDYEPTDGKQTVFSRYIYFTGAYLAPENGIGNPDKILKLESHVKYKKGGYEQEVVLESFIGEIR